MNNQVKIILYIVFLTGACVFGSLFYHSYTSAAARAAEEKSDPVVASETNTPPTLATNATPAPTLTNATNVATATNTVNATNTVSATNPASVTTASAASGGRHYGRMMGFGSAAFAFVVGLAMLIANDFSRFMANRAEVLLFNDDGAPMKNPDYDEAEQVWTDGRHLEAIQLMRDILKKNPREQHIALRIAEIYEKDLGNPLAAALEYEEVLKQKLTPDRWAWSAIHLANLYSGKLNKIDEAVALLRRIVAERGGTPAAEKARLRLAQLDVGTDPEPAAEAPAPAPAPANPSSKLPPGFRPRD